MQIDERWIDRLIASGLSPHTARQSVTTLRTVKADLDDEAFGTWFETVSLSEVLTIVATYHRSPPSEAHTGQVT